jgi:hypothetical protein
MVMFEMLWIQQDGQVFLAVVSSPCRMQEVFVVFCQFVVTKVYYTGTGPVCA